LQVNPGLVPDRLSHAVGQSDERLGHDDRCQPDYSSSLPVWMDVLHGNQWMDCAKTRWPTKTMLAKVGLPSRRHRGKPTDLINHPFRERRTKKAETRGGNLGFYILNIWRQPTLAEAIQPLPSARLRLTAVFGMGTGRTTAS